MSDRREDEREESDDYIFDDINYESSNGVLVMLATVFLVVLMIVLVGVYFLIFKTTWTGKFAIFLSIAGYIYLRRIYLELLDKTSRNGA